MEGDNTLSKTIPSRINYASCKGVKLRQEDLKYFAQNYMKLAPGIRESITKIFDTYLDVVMALISGGPQECVNYVGDLLSICPDLQIGNQIKLTKGEYDIYESQIRNFKKDTVGEIKSKINFTKNSEQHIHIGDGKTAMTVRADHIIRSTWVIDRKSLEIEYPETMTASIPINVCNIMRHKYKESSLRGESILHLNPVKLTVSDIL